MGCHCALSSVFCRRPAATVIFASSRPVVRNSGGRAPYRFLLYCNSTALSINSRFVMSRQLSLLPSLNTTAFPFGIGPLCCCHTRRCPNSHLFGSATFTFHELSLVVVVSVPTGTDVWGRISFLIEVALTPV